MSFSGTYFDGSDVRGREVQVEVGEDLSLSFRGEGVAIDAPQGGYSLTRPLARVPRFAALPGGRLEVPWTEEADEALRRLDGPPRGLIRLERWLGSHIGVAAGVAGVLVSALVALVAVGLPRAARRIAFAVPASIEARAGKASQAAMLRFTLPTPFVGAAGGQVRAELGMLSRVRALHVQPTVLFVNMQQPNAFALPGGTIVVTQGLLDMKLSDEEIAAVLAHELGHEELRHGLQKVLRDSAALVIVSLITGDLSTLTTFSGTLPAVLLTRGYSREFEREADHYAVELLNAAEIDPEALASALEKLERQDGQKNAAKASYLSTHPVTAERIVLIRSEANAGLTAADCPRMIADAREARRSREFKRSLSIYLRAFNVLGSTGSVVSPSDQYDAGCTAAQGGDSAWAYVMLETAMHNGLKDPKRLVTDPDLVSLHQDLQWLTLVSDATGAKPQKARPGPLRN